MNPKTVAILGTLDTKGEEFAFLRTRIESAGVATLVIDSGILGEPAFAPAISRWEVARASGHALEDLLATRDRGESIAVMAAGAVVVGRLFEEGKIQGLISLGGSAGTTIGTAAMRSLPAGFPKVMVSTLASGDTRPYVGTKDIVMLFPVVDIAGLNLLTRRILANAAAAIAGMVLQKDIEGREVPKPLIAATMFGVTTLCVTMARRILEQSGFEVLVFHATGTGGQAMEDLIADGYVAGVLD